MIPFIITALFGFFIYLVFTAGSGNIGLWSSSELIAGGALGILTGIVTRNFLCRKRNYRMVNPFRLAVLACYIVIPFFVEMTKANLDVAYRVITMNIRPGIIRVHSNLKTDFGIFMLANSITLTPGTITVDIDEKTHDLYVHNINVPTGEESKEVFQDHELFTYFNLPSWIRRIAE
ncbi:MAG: Na+/H+ antiporter subunit E [Methanomicrobiales archaeon]|nr:Na+/H+ antiporter subunit E [Methanomicrobiales archaeon]